VVEHFVQSQRYDVGSLTEKSKKGKITYMRIQYLYANINNSLWSSVK